MAYIIRQMKDRDIPGIMKIESVSFGTHHWTKESFRSEIKSDTGNYYTLYDDDINKVVGYAGYWLIIDEAHVTTIAVHPEFRRNHLGEVLLQHLIDKSIQRKARWLTLEVRISNIGAQNLYYKYAFSSLGLRRKYYQDNSEDALIMWTDDMHTEKFQNMYNEHKNNLLKVLDKEVKYL